jgi:hypothetical protein
VDHATNRNPVLGRSTHNLFSILTELFPVKKWKAKFINTKRKQRNIGLFHTKVFPDVVYTAFRHG